MTVSILTSGIGLGVYMPALVIDRQLRASGVEVAIEVLEGYFTADAQRRHLAHKQAYHQNFDLALMAHKMARGVEASFDVAQVDALIDRWADERRTRFILWSGFWLPMLARYRERISAPLRVHSCRIDAVVSASFRAHDSIDLGAEEIWLWNLERKSTVFEIPVDDRRPVPFADRDDRLVTHGGGWGLGTYRDVTTRLGSTDWSFDVVVHDAVEADASRPGDRYFMVDPEWRTWHRRGGGHTFPPFGELRRGRDPGNDHALYERIRTAKAIVSKPGGGTLIDSLSSATPVVLLEPYGYAEAANGEVWEHLGFGISYARWAESGFSEAVLARLHENLVSRTRGPSYARYCLEALS